MIDYIELGPTPHGEQCAQVGDSDYSERARLECLAYIGQLRRTHPEKCEKIRLKKQSFPHDFGSYYEVVARFSDENEDAAAAAVFLENNAPEYWDAEAIEYLQENGYFGDEEEDSYFTQKERNP